MMSDRQLLSVGCYTVGCDRRQVPLAVQHLGLEPIQTQGQVEPTLRPVATRVSVGAFHVISVCASSGTV